MGVQEFVHVGFELACARSERADPEICSFRDLLWVSRNLSRYLQLSGRLMGVQEFVQRVTINRLR